MPVVGRAEVLVSPSFKGAQTAIKKQLTGSAGQGMATAASAGIGSKITGAIGGALKAGMVTAGVGAGAVLGGAITKGFGRLNAIEQAQAKLSGLGHSAKDIKAIMSDALASVKGTAFGLDEAAQVSAQAVAAGIKPGKELRGVLTTVADTATIAGSSMGEMGSIFGSVAARGKLQGDDLMQLQERGIPVLQFLAEHYGVTAKKASEMVSKGKVDFKAFEQAMSDNLGGAAQKSGKTTQGAWKNMWASISRVGANALSGIFPKLQGAFTGITDWLEPIEGKAKKVGAAIGGFINRTVKWFTQLAKSPGAQTLRDNLTKLGTALRDAVVPAAKSLAGTFKNQILPRLKDVAGFVVNTLIPGITSLVGWLTKNKNVVVPLVAALATGIAVYKTVIAVTKAWAVVQGVLNAVMALNPIGLVIAAVAALVVGFIVAYKKSETFRKIVNAAMNAVKKVFVAVWNWIKDKFVPFFTKTLPNAFQSVVDWVKKHWKLILSILTGPIGAAVIAIITHKDEIVETFQDAWQWVKRTFKKLWNGFKQILLVPIEAARDGIETATDKIQGFFSAIWDWVKGTFKRTWKGLKLIFTDPLQAAKNIFNNTIGRNSTLRGIFTGIWDWVSGTFKRSWKGLKLIFTDPMQAAKNVFKNLFGGGGPVRNVFSEAVDAIGRIWDKIKDKMSAPIKWVVDKVLNGVLIKGVNKIANFVGLGGKDGRVLGDIPTRGLARGGVLPGYTPVSRGDDQLVPMRSGEGVYVSEAMRDPYERARLHAVNAAALAGRSLRKFRGYALGGLVGGSGSFSDEFRKRLLLAQQLAGTQFSIFQRGFRPRTSYSGTSHQGDAVDLGPVTRVVVAALRRVGIAAWDRTGKGNWAPHIHGVPLPGAGQAAGSAIWQAQDFLRGGDGLGGRDSGPRGFIGKALGWVGGKLKGVVGGIGDILNPGSFLTDAVKSALGTAKNVFNSPFGNIVRHVPTKLASMALEWAKDKIGGPFGGSGATASWSGKGIGGWSRAQLNNAATIIATARKLGFGDRGAKIALMTALQESTLRNLSYGDRDSVGLFQQRNAWGSFGARTNPAKAAAMFFQGGAAGQRGLGDFNWRNMGLGEAAQAVQVSAFPGAYSKWADEASQILGAFKHRKGYDSGGLLMPGYTLAYNGTNKPEPVFTDDQFKRMNAGSGKTLNIGQVGYDPKEIFSTWDRMERRSQTANGLTGVPL